MVALQRMSLIEDLSDPLSRLIVYHRSEVWIERVVVHTEQRIKMADT